MQGGEEQKGAEEMAGAEGVGEEARGVGSSSPGVLGQGAPPFCHPTASCFRPDSARIPAREPSLLGSTARPQSPAALFVFCLTSLNAS